MKCSFNFLFLVLRIFNLSGAHRCVFDNFQRSEWEPNYYACLLSSAEDEIQEVHLPYKSNDDVLVIGSNSGTKLQNLTIKFSMKFKNIEVVELRHAGIESIDNNLLINCHNIKLVDFSENKIREIPENLFAHSLKLKEIALGGNNLVTLPENVFQNLSKLEMLTLHDNRIVSLSPKTFEGLENLRELYLGNNKLTTLDLNLFKDLKKLETLYLNSNQISELEENIFINLINLRTLVLKNNLLDIIHQDSFGVLEDLRNVDLSFNNIVSIDEKFVDRTGVMVLLMQHNFCTNDNVQNKMEMKKVLRQCFENYEPRDGKYDSKFSPIEHQITSSDSFECGKPIDVSLRNRIVYGTQIEHGDFPWLAILITSDGDYQCGGSLITSSKVVTAAHCVTSSSTFTIIQSEERKVLLGVYDFNEQNETDRALHSISKIIVHPEWKFLKNFSYDADVAVLELADHVQFTHFIRPICLMEPYTILETISVGIVVGFGKSEDVSKEHENIARLVKTPIHSNEHCLLSNGVIREMSSNRTFCGGYANGTGVCRGDSGNGLIVFYNNTYYLRGLVSGSIWGDKYECDVDNYAVFTDLTKFYKWITTGDLDPEPSTEQKIERLVLQIRALVTDKNHIDLVKNLIVKHIKKAFK